MTYISSAENRISYPKVILILVVLLSLVFAGFFVKGKYFGATSSDGYKAVFLTNGQVYFGQVVSSDRKYMKLSNVYYLQVSSNGESVNVNEPQMKLIKLGTELHGPENEMYVNQSNILFYENLREDSKIIESIKNYK